MLPAKPAPAGRSASCRTSIPRFEHQEVVVHSPRHVRTLRRARRTRELGARRRGLAAAVRSCPRAGLPYVHALSTRAAPRARASRTRTRSSSGCASRRRRREGAGAEACCRLPARSERRARGRRAGEVARGRATRPARAPSSSWSRRASTTRRPTDDASPARSTSCATASGACARSRARPVERVAAPGPALAPRGRAPADRASPASSSAPGSTSTRRARERGRGLRGAA